MSSSETKHSAGTWLVSKHQTIASDYWGIHTAEGLCVADIVHEDSDARLIAAAPKLLAALKIVQHEVDGMHPRSLRSYLPTEVIVQIELALAAAEA